MSPDTAKCPERANVVPPNHPKAQNLRLFNRFQWRLTVPAFSFARFLPASRTLYLVGTGKTAIFRSFVLINRRVRCLSTSSDLKYRACLISRSPGWTYGCS